MNVYAWFPYILDFSTFLDCIIISLNISLNRITRYAIILLIAAKIKEVGINKGHKLSRMKIKSSFWFQTTCWFFFVPWHAALIVIISAVTDTITFEYILLLTFLDHWVVALYIQRFILFFIYIFICYTALFKWQ